MSDKRTKLDIHLLEFEKCKAEQMARIAFRDNLVYVTLVAYGGIVAFAAKDNHLALLVLPWVSLVFGWEVAHRNDARRKRRKTFCFSSWAAPQRLRRE